MSKTLTLKIPDNTYKRLIEQSAQTGQTPEQMIIGIIENRIDKAEEDALLQLAGIFESALTDISESHDSYIGEAVASNGK